MKPVVRPESTPFQHERLRTHSTVPRQMEPRAAASGSRGSDHATRQPPPVALTVSPARHGHGILTGAGSPGHDPLPRGRGSSTAQAKWNRERQRADRGEATTPLAPHRRSPWRSLPPRKRRAARSCLAQSRSAPDGSRFMHWPGEVEPRAAARGSWRSDHRRSPWRSLPPARTRHSARSCLAWSRSAPAGSRFMHLPGEVEPRAAARGSWRSDHATRQPPPHRASRPIPPVRKRLAHWGAGSPGHDPLPMGRGSCTAERHSRYTRPST